MTNKLLGTTWLGWLAVLAVAGLSLLPQVAQASHIRAGDIQARVDTTAAHNPFRIFFKMVLYLDITNGPTSVDQPTATIFFGDGTSSCSGVPRRGGRQAIPGTTDTGLSVYYFEHTYSTTGFFTVSFVGENRNAGVVNMSTPDQQSFYISTFITIDPTLGLNHSPVLTAPAIGRGAVGQVFLHNPAAFDADGDSLAFHLRFSQQVATLAADIVGPPCATGTGDNRPKPVPCTNYRYPNDPLVTPANNPPVQVDYINQYGVQTGIAGQRATFTQDYQTGVITWNAPVAAGIYNVAMEVEEWRRTPLHQSRLIGLVIRDMQIIVTATNNVRPTLTIPADICVVAGQTVTGAVTATDGYRTSPSEQTPVTLYAYSGILPPASFVQSTTGPPTARGTFTWRTDCSNVAERPYLVVFKAQDTPTSPTTPALIDEKTWRITVVGPAPQNLQARAVVATGSNVNTAVLTWNQYLCANATRIHIYRKLNSSGFVPGPCDTGIPASAGYTRIASVAATATSYTDTNPDANGNVQGLARGQTYCYRIYAEFPLPALGESIASQEACLTTPGRAALLTNVDVETTSTTTGQITVRWTQPRAAPGAVLGGTPSYVLSRGVGPSPATFTPVRAPFTSPTDTTYVDSGLNTQDVQYVYKLEFIRTFPAGQGGTITEVSPTASSVLTRAVPQNATRIVVSWTYNVPWDNAASSQPTVIYRRTGGTGPFTRIGTAVSTATGGTYTDADNTLRKGEQYCYYVQTNGRYATYNFLNSLLNKSQEWCVRLVSAPCRPVLALQATNCDSLAALPEFPRAGEHYTNRLRWSLGGTPTGCDGVAASYRVYYRPTPTGAFTLIATTAQTSYSHTSLDFSGGCYAVQAVAPSTLLSDTSNVVCQDNCLFFRLPNIFTPTGDGINDTFRPKNNSPIRSIHFQAFNRWGVKVFENTTTASDAVLINWTGGGATGDVGAGRKVSEGIYYYLAQVEFADFANTKRTYKGWVELVR